MKLIVILSTIAALGICLLMFYPTNNKEECRKEEHQQTKTLIYI